MSDLDTAYPVALAACVNALDATAHASAETMGAGEMWARICNAVGGGPVSHLRTPVSEIVARVRNAVTDPPAASRFRRDQLALIADIRNALSDAPDLSRLTTTGGQLLILTLASLAGFSGGGSSVPSWVEALRAPSGDLPLFAYNFASGGTGQGWDGTNAVTLTVSQSWAPGAPMWNTANIIDGLGLQASSTSNGFSVVGLLPPITVGCAVLMKAQAYSPVSAATTAPMYAYMMDLPDSSGVGGLGLEWVNAETNTELELFDATGTPTGGENISPKVAVARGAMNYFIDGSTLVGSINGRPTVTGTGSVAPAVPNSLNVSYDHVEATPPIYITLVAVYALQPAGDLPTLSAL